MQSCQKPINRYDNNPMALITLFDPWKNELCTCPDKYSLAPYTGCGHGCLYCYASSYIPGFSSPRPKKNFLERAGQELKKIKAGSYIALSNSSDPYQPLEQTHGLTRQLLLLAARQQLKIMIVTKSVLPIRDIDILKDLYGIVISMSLTTLDPGLSRLMEPGAPLPQQRLKAMEKLSRYFPVACRIDPLIPGLNSEGIKTLVRQLKNCGVSQIISSTYKAKGDNFNRMKKAFPHLKEKWTLLYKEKGEKKGGNMYLPEKTRRDLIKKVKTVAQNEQLAFSCCREGFSSLNTAACDGSDLFAPP